MKFSFDHVVQFSEDPNMAITYLKEKGIHAVKGGEHQNRPTYNVLSYFDLSYIEIIGTTDKEYLKRMDHPKHSMIKTVIDSGFAEGFARFVVRTEDIDAAADHFREQGLTVNGPVYLSRKRPDGSLIEWRLLFVGNDAGGPELPFIIQWNESDEQRRKELTEQGIIATHPSGINFSHISIAVKNLADTVKIWSHLLNAEAGKEFIDEEIQASCQTLEFEGGNVTFCSPIADGIVSEVLEESGEKPFQLNFSNGENPETFELFNGIYKIRN